MTPLTPRPYQLADAKKVRSSERKRYLLTYTFGVGKCLGKGTPVLMHDGRIVPVEEVETGDLLMGPDSTPRRVLSTTVGYGSLYRIIPKRGDPWVCNEDHVLVVAESTPRKREYEIPLRDHIAKKPYLQNTVLLFSPEGGVDFPRGKKLPIDPYFVGIWLGDGSKLGMRGVSVTKPDEEVRKLSKDTAAAWGMRFSERNYSYSTCPTFAISAETGKRNPLLNELRRLFGSKDVERIPLEYLTASRTDRSSLLAGLIDSDGSFMHGTCEVTQKRQCIADAVAFLARSLGFKVTSRLKIVNGLPYTRLFIHGDFSVLPLRIPRKIQPPRRQIKRPTYTGFRVEPLGDGDYYGFTLDGDGRFLLGDFTVTHNTLASTLACTGVSPGVVICRTHLVLQWVKHLEREFPGASIGSVIERTPRGWRALDRAAKVAMLTRKPAYDWYVLTFATIRRIGKSKASREAMGQRTLTEQWRDHAEEKGWIAPRKQPTRSAFEYPLPLCRALIVDESQYARRVTSQQFKGLYQLAVPTASRKAAEVVLLLTATPVYREPDDLFAQLRLLDPQRFRSYWNFVDRYCVLEETDYGSKVIGGNERRIAKLLSEYAIHRDYSDPEVSIAVPDLIPEEVWTYLTPSSQKQYDKLASKLSLDRSAGFSVGSGIAEFSRVTASDPNKIEALTEVIEGLGSEPFALFGWYRDTVRGLASRFKLPYFLGDESSERGVTPYTRAEAIQQAGSFAASIGCIQEGVDLSHLRTMIFYESDYTHGGMEQLRRRLQRWRQDGSTDKIRCIYVLADETVDSIAYDASQTRGATVDAIAREIAAQATRRLAVAP